MVSFLQKLFIFYFYFHFSTWLFFPVIVDNVRSSASQNSGSEPNVVKPIFPFTMSGDGVDDIHIPALLVSRENGVTLRTLVSTYEVVRVLLSSGTEEEIKELQEAANKSEQSHSNQSGKSNISSP